MIDFRYHIVSIVAIFFALALGILVGTTVLDRAVVDGLEGQIRRLGSGLDDARAEITELRERDEQTSELLSQVSSWAAQDRLAGTSILLVSEGPDTAWYPEVLAALDRAGAEIAGSITLTERWMLPDEQDADELELLVQGVVPGFRAEQDVVSPTLRVFGERLLEPTGRTLLDSLAAAGFLTVEQADEDPDWPSADTRIVVLSAASDEQRLDPRRLATFARAAGGAAPTVVVTGSPEATSAVSVLREANALPPTLATFDAAADDQTGIAVALVVESVLHERGGHYGLEEDRTFLPEPPPRPTPTPPAPEDEPS